MQRLIALFLITFIAACSTSQKVNESTPSERQASEPIIIYSDQEIAEAKQFFIRGTTAFEMQNYEEALDLLTMAYIKLPNHAGVNYALADAYMYQSDFTNAAYYAKEAIAIDQSNKHYHVKLAEIHLRAREGQAAIKALEDALALFPKDLELSYLLAGIYTESGEYEKSNAIYDQILTISGDDTQVYYQKFRNYSLMENEEAASNQLLKMYEIDPTNTAILQTLSANYLENEEYDKAIELFEIALEQNPLQIDLKLTLADIYTRMDDWGKARGLLLDIFDDPNVNADVKSELVQFIMARFLRDQENAELSSFASEVVERFATENPENSDAQALAADFYLLIDDEPRAMEKLREAVRLMPYNEPAWRQLLQLYFTSAMYDEIIEIATTVEEYVPEDAFIRFFIGNAYGIQGYYNDAIVWLKLASEAPARGNFKSIVYGSLGDNYQSADDWTNAKKSYEESIRLDPDNATSLNNYAYYLSVRNENLEEAYEMSQRSITFQPENSSFLDTLGWIYYKLEDYENAYKYIQLSIENGGSSATILEHMGDVYKKLGKMDEAREWWEKAFDVDPDREYLRDRINQ
jgi:tetratricopeptide (TPR) repeat protein